MEKIAEALCPMIEQDRLTVPRGGCPIKRGRKRTVVEFFRRSFLPDDCCVPNPSRIVQQHDLDAPRHHPMRQGVRI